MLTPYMSSVHLIERMHRQFLELIKAELDQMGEETINNVQALILYNIGKDQMTVGELTERGYYQGSNVSYNVKKLVENGYLLQEPSPHDKRSVRIKLSEKGLAFWERMTVVFDRHIQALQSSAITQEDLIASNNIFFKLEAFWENLLKQASKIPYRK